MNRRRRALAGLGVAAALALAVAVLAALRTERGARAAIALVGDASGYAIAIGKLEVSDWQWTAHDVRVGGGDDAFFRARGLTLELAPASLLRGVVRSVAIDGFEIDLAQLPASKGGRARRPFEELRASDGVVHHASATFDEIRIPVIVFARAQQGGGFDIRGRLESDADLEVVWSGHAAATGDDLTARVEGTLRNVVQTPQLASMLGVDSTATVSFHGDVSGSLHGDLHAAVVADMSFDALRVPVRAVAAIDYKDATAEIAYKADVTADGVTSPLKISGRIRQRSVAEPLELNASWRDLDLSEAASLLRDRSRFDARAGRLSLDASARGALRTPAFRVAIDARDLAVTASTIKVAGNGALSFAYAEGALTSRDDGLTLDGLEISAPAMKAAIKHLRAEPRVQIDSETTSFRLEHVTAEGVAFSDTGSELQASGIEVSGRLDLSLDAARDRIASLALSAPRGEVLYKRAYLDITSSPAEFSLRATSKEATWTGQARLLLANLGELRADGDFDSTSDGQRLHVEAEIPSLRAPFEKLVRDTFADTHPMLARTTLDGAASVDVEILTTASARSMSGRLRLHDATLDVEDPALHSRGIVLDLPIALSTGQKVDDKPASGRLRIDETTLGNAVIATIDLPLTIRTNEIVAGAPLRTVVAHGVVLVQGLRAHSLASETPTLEGDIEIMSLDLADLTGAAGLPRVDGRVDGTLGRVRIAGGGVTTNAAIDIATFGGNVHISDVSMDELFSRVPALSVDAVFSRIDLSKATDAMGVGYVSGIAEGEVKDLEIAAGSPVRFDARLESVHVSGISQRISVTAIDQLAVLGGGSSGSLARGMMGFFDEYRYAKLGFRCSLRNDRFVLHGVTEHDGKDFLIVGTIMPPTVNVVSHNPVIAFNEMVERLQRVTSVSRPEPEHQGAGEKQ